MAQSRQKLGKIRLSIDDTLLDTKRRPMMTLVEDTSSGVHDMLYPPCDAARYAEADQDGHDSCAGNLRTALRDAQDSKLVGEGSPVAELEQCMEKWGWTPEPLNLFMNVPLDHDGILQLKRPECEKDSYVILRAEMECLLVMSACPNDLLDTNGGEPGPAAYEVLS